MFKEMPFKIAAKNKIELSGDFIITIAFVKWYNPVKITILKKCQIPSEM